jgi:hypothetical protein
LEGLLTDECKNLDLSAMSFDQFVDFLFNRGVVPDNEQFYYFLTDPAGERYDIVVPSSPAVLVNHMTRLFSDFGQIAGKYSLAQVDQGVWAILGENLRSYEYLYDPAVPLLDRLNCIRSMYFVYPDFVVAAQPDSNVHSGFYMWWDFILHGFWGRYRGGTDWDNASKLDAESRVLLDVMFETLKRILDVPDKVTQYCALHGLGHLHHPEVHDTVQRYIDTHKSEFPLKWLEQCRDCTVL